MTDPNTPEPEDEALTLPARKPEGEPEPVRYARTRRALKIAAICLAGLAVLMAALAVGGRFYLLSPAGRDLVLTFVEGREIGRYGAINVEGVKGDLWSDFTIERLTVTDVEGVWIEATNARVKWNYWALIARRFDAREITAERIRFLRRPELGPEPELPPGRMPLDVRIRSFATEVELMEDFSQDYGQWRLEGEAHLLRAGSQNLRLSADSLSRPGDFLRAEVRMGEGEPLFVRARAEEASGGPLAGALGYSPREPFLLNVAIDEQQVRARLRTGDFMPLFVEGDFSQQGGTLTGLMDFSGSDLLAPFAERIGQRARFGFAAVPDARREGVYGVAWTLLADNITSRAQGLVVGETRESINGLRIEVSTPSLTRLTGTDIAGESGWRGTWTGTPERWQLRGEVSLSGAALAGYRLGALQGPLNLEWTDTDATVTADLQGRAGSGAGVVGTLLGAAPRLQADIRRMGDGRLLMRRLDVRGRSLILTGNGARALNGGLNFRADAQISDASVLRDGATGALRADVRASQNRPGQPWQFGLDARASRLNTGMELLDHLLGESPRLQGNGRLERGEIAIERASLSGQNATLNTRGILDPGGPVRLLMDWTATGPFGIGPVEIVGDMSGDGAITGTVDQPRLDFRAGFSEVDVGALTLTDTRAIVSFRRGADESDGRVAIQSASNYGPASASANIFIRDEGVRLEALELDAGGVRARGAVALNGATPSSADLVFSARPGAFLQSGAAEGTIRLTEGAGSETAWLDVSGRNVRFTGSTYLIRTFDLAGRGTLERLPFTLRADVGGATPIAFDGRGLFSRAGERTSVALEGGGRVREVAFTTRSPATLTMQGERRDVSVDLGIGNGTLSGSLNQDARSATLTASLQQVDLGSIAADLAGQITGEVNLSGTGESLGGTATLAIQNARSRGSGSGPSINANVGAEIAGSRMSVRAIARDSEGATSQVNLVLPVVASAAPLRLAVVNNQPISGNATLSGQIQPIWDLFFGDERTLSGVIDAQTTIAGTLQQPSLNGQLSLSRGRLRDAGAGLTLSNLEFATRFDGSSAVIERFSANDGGRGTVTGTGRLNLQQGSTSTLTLTFQRFELIDNDLIEATATGPITVTRAADGNIALAGRLRIDEAEIAPNPPTPSGVVRMDVIEINRPGGDIDTREERSRGPVINLDITLDASDGRVFVRGRGLDVEMAVEARVGGTLSQPTLTGTANVVRGDYEFAGKRFVFDPRGSVSLSTRPDRIRLNLTATREDPALTATVRVTGTAAQPEITLTSVPALPQDEILSQVLFGRSASQLSAIEAAQLASSTASLTGGGGFDVLGNLREFAGLDRLSFGGEASAITIAGGKYLTDDIYLEIIGGGRDGAAIQIEWQPRQNVAVVSRVSGDGNAALSVRWRQQTRQPGTEARGGRRGWRGLRDQLRTD